MGFETEGLSKQQQIFETARGIMEIATGAGEDDRKALERCAVRYFYQACGIAAPTPAVTGRARRYLPQERRHWRIEGRGV